MINIDYAKLSYRRTEHHKRFVKRVLQTKLICQECRGLGGEREVILDDGSGPWIECGWCEGTGYVTPWLRGMWLRMKRKGAKA